MSLQTIPICNVCKTENVRVEAHLRSDVDGNTYDAVRCKECGLVFAWPIPLSTAEMLSTLYGDSYTEGQRSVQEDQTTVQMLRDATHRQMQIVEQFVRPGKALNVGAMGSAVTVLQDRGWTLQVVEVSAYAARSARENWGLDVVVSSIEEYEAEEESFDFVKLGHVIEHLADPAAVIHKLKRLLRPGGVMMIDTDNAEGLRTKIEVTGRRLMGERFSATVVRRTTGKNLHKRYGRLTPPEHLYTFNKRSLCALLKESDLLVRYVTTPAWGDPIWFPIASRTRYSKLERAFMAIDSVGARLGHGEVVAVIAQKR